MTHRTLSERTLLPRSYISLLLVPLDMLVTFLSQIKRKHQPSVSTPAVVRGDGDLATRIRVDVVHVQFEWLGLVRFYQCEQILRLKIYTKKKFEKYILYTARLINANYLYS